MKESQIQRAILEYLAARRILAFRQNTGMHIAERNGKSRAIRYGVPGMADIIAFRVQNRGVDDIGNWCEFTEIMPLFIEVKTATGKQSELQASFQKQVEEHGCRYIVARSVEDVEEALR